MSDAIQRMKLFAGQQCSAWKRFPEQRRLFDQCPAGRPVFITGAPRSGTTWMAAMLASPGMWHLHEPFNPNNGLWPEEFTYVSSSGGRDDVNRLLSRICNGGTRCALHVSGAGHWMMPLRWMPLKPGRLLLKDPIASLMAGYITRQVDCFTLALFRHPAGFVHSLQRLKWPSSHLLRKFLNTPALMAERLAPYSETMRRHSDSDSLMSAAVLHACLCRVLWEDSQTSEDIIPVSYEEVASNPVKEFPKIYQQLDLPCSPEDLQRHHDLTSSSHGSSVGDSPHEVRRDSRSVAQKWRGAFRNDELCRIREIWEQFEVPFYSSDAEWERSGRLL